MTSGLSGDTGQYQAPNRTPFAPAKVKLRQIGPSCAGKRIVSERGRSTPQNKIFNFWPGLRSSGRAVRERPATKCVMAQACRDATKFSVAKAARHTATAMPIQRLIFFFKAHTSVVFLNLRVFIRLRSSSNIGAFHMELNPGGFAMQSI
jgi:hypothetical protein